jgi:hypothetical protein
MYKAIISLLTVLLIGLPSFAQTNVESPEQCNLRLMNEQQEAHSKCNAIKERDALIACRKAADEARATGIDNCPILPLVACGKEVGAKYAKLKAECGSTVRKDKSKEETARLEAAAKCKQPLDGLKRKEDAECKKNDPFAKCMDVVRNKIGESAKACKPKAGEELANCKKELEALHSKETDNCLANHLVYPNGKPQAQ